MTQSLLQISCFSTKNYSISVFAITFRNALLFRKVFEYKVINIFTQCINKSQFKVYIKVSFEKSSNQFIIISIIKS